jgi:hypothetical protein
MRYIEHFSIQHYGAVSAPKRGDDSPCLIHLRRVRCENLIDDRCLIWVDRNLARKAVGSGLFGALSAAIGITYIDENGVDCQDIERVCSQQTLRPRMLVHRSPPSIGGPGVRGTQYAAEILSPPHQTRKSR